MYKVCELEDLETATRRLVEKLAKGPAQSYRVMKEMMWNSFLAGWEEYKKFEVENQCKLGLSEDHSKKVYVLSQSVAVLNLVNNNIDL